MGPFTRKSKVLPASHARKYGLNLFKFFPNNLILNCITKPKKKCIIGNFKLKKKKKNRKKVQLHERWQKN